MQPCPPELQFFLTPEDKTWTNIKKKKKKRKKKKRRKKKEEEKKCAGVAYFDPVYIETILKYL